MNLATRIFTTLGNAIKDGSTLVDEITDVFSFITLYYLSQEGEDAGKTDYKIATIFTFIFIISSVVLQQSVIINILVQRGYFEEENFKTKNPLKKIFLMACLTCIGPITVIFKLVFHMIYETILTLTALCGYEYQRRTKKKLGALSKRIFGLDDSDLF